MSTQSLAGRPFQFTFRRFRLRIVDGVDKGSTHDSDGAEFSIGTEAGNQLVLRDPTVSRHHCVITATPHGFHLRDVGSTNGTYLAGHRVESAFLNPGSTIRIGVTTLRFESLEEEVHEPLSDEERFGRALGQSLAMRRIFALLPRLAASDVTVLLEGETGTGKGLLAEAIHSAGPRARKPFVTVDCGSIPPTLIESELFGHERGAYTGAH